MRRVLKVNLCGQSVRVNRSLSTLTHHRRAKSTLYVRVQLVLGVMRDNEILNEVNEYNS